MKEIGGYIEFEHYFGNLMHGEAIKLNSGRNCLEYLIKANHIRKIKLPKYLCDCVLELCMRNDVEIDFYSIGYDFRPCESIVLEKDEWMYIVNYFGQLSYDDVLMYKAKYNKLILDNSQSYYSKRVDGVNTFYTCRKYFGVPDGAFLYTEKKIKIQETDESFNRITFLTGRFERSGSEFYNQYRENEDRISKEKVKRMSKMTENLLRAIDYETIREKRNANYNYLMKQLYKYNRLELVEPDGAFMFPFMTENAIVIREKLIKKGIYIPVLWKNVIDNNPRDSLEYILTTSLLPLPVDQRYGIEEMEYIVNEIKKEM